jgi:hypothetical protein
VFAVLRKISREFDKCNESATEVGARGKVQPQITYRFPDYTRFNIASKMLLSSFAY